MAYPQIPTAIDRKTRIKIPYEPQAARPVAERIKDSREVHLPLTPEQAMREASRCLQCPMAPCVKACPAGNDIPGALRKIEQGDFLGAAEIYRRTSSLAQICGRVCPQDQLCQGSCVRNKTDGPVLCGALEAFVADFEREQNPFRIVPDAPSATPVAVVGSGPAGLVCAEQLVIRGYRVTVFEAAAAPGGMLTYGIPGFKMDPAVVRSLVEDLRHAGVEFRFGTKIGKSLTVDGLFADGFQAVFLGTGAAVPTCLQVPGADLPEVYPPDEFLARLNVDPAALPAAWRGRLSVGEHVVVIGGGDTAADCLRSAMRMGAGRVTCLYRRTEAEMPGGKKDRLLAVEEGAEYRFLTQPIRFQAGDDGRVCAVECLECRLGEPDADGRRRPIPIDGSNFTVEADTIVCALGYEADPEIGRSTPGLVMDRNGLLQVDPQTGTSPRPGVFAAGDVVSGPDLVVTAMSAARRAAESIDRYLRASAD